MTASSSLGTLIDQLSAARVLVIGDVMLDRFVSGDVTRISPERPVPVLAVSRDIRMLGGAGNVIANLRSLGAQASVIGLVGMDTDGHEVRTLLDHIGVPTVGLVTVADRPTITKTRFMSSGQHLLRVDDEKVLPLSAEMEDALLTNLKVQLSECQLLVLSDYGKGVLSPRVIREAIAAATSRKIPVLVDPKGRDFSRYSGATILTPNLKELAEATGLSVKTDADVTVAAEALRGSSGVASLIVTRSEKGMSIFESGDPAIHLPTEAIEVFDVSGAGDTVIATLAATLAGGASLKDAARLANIAAGLVVAKVGTATVLPQEMRDRLGLSGSVTATRTWDQARDQVRQWQAQGLKVGFTNGCFDILHAGHVNYLNETRQYCDRLVLGLNHDQSVRILKGPSRPVNVEQDRAAVMAGLNSVSLVVLFGATEAGADNTPCELIKQIQPDIFFKGGDYTIASLPEAAVVHGYGGEVKIMGLTAGLSTTKTIEKIGAGKAA